MKHFIYLDTNIVNSYIAQANEGLKIRSNEEVSDSTAVTKIESETVKGNDIQTNFNFGFASMKTDFLDSTSKESDLLSSSKTGRELIEKFAHDDVFNRFLKTLKENEGIKTDDIKINDYVELQGKYSIYDLDYLIDYFSSDVIDFIADQELKQFNLADKLKKIKRTEIISNYKYIVKMINLSKKSLPYNQFMILDNNFIVLKEEYLRETVNAIRFTHSDNIKIIGKYTKNYEVLSSKGTNTTIDGVFNSLDNVISAFLSGVLNINNSTRIIIPTALYFE